MTRVSSCASPEPSGTSVSPGWSRATAPLFFSETGIGQDKIQLRQSVNPGPAPCCSQVPLLWCLCSRREISTPSSSRRRRQMSSVGVAPARRRGHGSSLLAPPPVGARRDAGVRAAPARPAVYVYPRLLQRDRRAEAAAASISATVLRSRFHWQQGGQCSAVRPARVPPARICIVQPSLVVTRSLGAHRALSCRYQPQDASTGHGRAPEPAPGSVSSCKSLGGWEVGTDVLVLKMLAFVQTTELLFGTEKNAVTFGYVVLLRGVVKVAKKRRC